MPSDPVVIAQDRRLPFRDGYPTRVVPYVRHDNEWRRLPPHPRADVTHMAYDIRMATLGDRQMACYGILL